MQRLTFLLAASFLLPCFANAQSSLPVQDARFDGTVGRTYKDSDPAHFPARLHPVKGAPNIVLILLDDVGFGQFSVFGGAVPSPALEKLAADGLRYNRFHTAGICSPTRAALLTGRNSHKAGFGNVGEMSNGYDGYIGFIPNTTATVAKVLQEHGYATAMFGKNHNTPAWEAGPAGPFDHWPTGMGFDYFYGFNGWGTDQWHPALFEDTTPVPPPSDPNYQLTADLVDHAITWMHNVESTTEKPFFLYLATGATHAPHQAPRKWIDRFKGQFDMGWDKYREITFAREKKLGVIPADAKLTQRPALVKAWDAYTPEQQHILARQMEVFAGFGAYTDHEVGRLIDAVKSLPGADNTLIVYLVGDNGASAEGGAEGELNELGPTAGISSSTSMFTPEVLAKLGGPEYNNHFAQGWAWAMNTPFKYYKQVVSHLGAIRNPLVIDWPRKIKDKGGLRTQFADVADIAPTLLDVAGIEMPNKVDGIAQKPLDGISLTYSFNDAAAAERRRTQYFEVWGNRGIYRDGWFASALLEPNPAAFDRSRLDPDKVKWELYDLDKDFTQADDLARQYPEKLRALQDLWWVEAAKNDVLPLDWRGVERMSGANRPNSVAGLKHFVYYPGMVALPEVIAPDVRNRSWTVAAQGKFASTDTGMLVTQGGNPGGWAFYIQDGKLVFDYNFALAAHYRIVSQPLPAAATHLEARFAYDGVSGKDRGKGGTVTLWADGKQIGTGRVERTLAYAFTPLEGLDVGADYGSPVSDEYPMPFPFKGELRSVSIDLN